MTALRRGGVVSRTGPEIVDRVDADLSLRPPYDPAGTRIRA